MSESIFERISAFLSKKMRCSAWLRIRHSPPNCFCCCMWWWPTATSTRRKLRLSRKLRRTILVFHRKNFSEVAEYLKDFGYETTTKQAANMLAEMAPSAVLRC